MLPNTCHYKTNSPLRKTTYDFAKLPLFGLKFYKLVSASVFCFFTFYSFKTVQPFNKKKKVSVKKVLSVSKDSGRLFLLFLFLEF